MRNPKVVLDSLAELSKRDKHYKFERLYRNLYNREFFLLAYSNMYAKEGNMTEGTDEKTIDGMSNERIDSLIKRLKDQTYRPNPARRVYIPKKNGDKRPLGIPSFEDKLVQEVVRMILNSIYDNSFSDKSHGFRPKRSCHTALEQIKMNFTSVRWFVEGDIKGFFDNISHHTLIEILRKRIHDEKFINLIWKFLKAGYIEEWKFHKTYSGTPQGGIISPILANVYLNELDEYIEIYKTEFDTGTTRKRNKEYRKALGAYEIRKKQYDRVWNELTEEEKKQAVKEVKELRKTAVSLERSDMMDPDYKRLQYARYADDFLIGIIGDKEDARKIKEDLTVFLRDKLELELSQEKTLITNSRERAKFLGYEISVNWSNAEKEQVNGHKRKVYKNKARLFMPKEAWIKKLFDTKTVIMSKKSGEWIPRGRNPLINSDDLEIISIYNAEIRGLYNYYKLADNVSSLNFYLGDMKRSFLKTLSRKYRQKGSITREKYTFGGKIGVKYDTKKGTKIRFFYDDGFQKVKNGVKRIDVDYIPDTLRYQTTTSLIERLNAEVCEWCGSKTKDLEVHHIRKLKDLKGKTMWEKRMIERKRKTMVMCKKCHVDLHAGRLD